MQNYELCTTNKNAITINYISLLRESQRATKHSIQNIVVL